MNIEYAIKVKKIYVNLRITHIHNKNKYFKLGKFILPVLI